MLSLRRCGYHGIECWMQRGYKLCLLFGPLALWLPLLSKPVSVEPGVGAIIQRSVQANQTDWKAAPEYQYTDRSREKGGSKTWLDEMIEGSPYHRLVAVNGLPLPPAEETQEQEKLDQTIARRRSETPEARARRIASYQRDRRRDHVLMEQLTDGMNFTFEGRQRVGSYECYVLQAKPRPGYRPPNTQAEVLTGMRGRLWIDTQSYQWVKVEATVVHPVSIEGFLARVEPGTRFELEEEPVGNGVWLPKHFSMSARAKVLLVFTYRTRQEDWYSGYRQVPSPAGSR